MTVPRTGQFAYVANGSSNNVSAYGVNGTTGVLTEVIGSPFTAGTFPFSVTVDPTGQFAYVANINSNNVSAYRINGTTGALTEVSGSPFPAGSRPRSVTVVPTGQFAYVANCGDGCIGGIGLGNVSGYSIDATTGALTEVAGSPFPAGTNPHSVTVDPTGQFAYAANLNFGALHRRCHGGADGSCRLALPGGRASYLGDDYRWSAPAGSLARDLVS